MTTETSGASGTERLAGDRASGSSGTRPRPPPARAARAARPAVFTTAYEAQERRSQQTAGALVAGRAARARAEASPSAPSTSPCGRRPRGRARRPRRRTAPAARARCTGPRSGAGRTRSRARRHEHASPRAGGRARSPQTARAGVGHVVERLHAHDEVERARPGTGGARSRRRRRRRTGCPRRRGRRIARRAGSRSSYGREPHQTSSTSSTGCGSARDRLVEAGDELAEMEIVELRERRLDGASGGSARASSADEIVGRAATLPTLSPWVRRGKWRSLTAASVGARPDRRAASVGRHLRRLPRPARRHVRRVPRRVRRAAGCSATPRRSRRRGSHGDRLPDLAASPSPWRRCIVPTGARLVFFRRSRAFAALRARRLDGRLEGRRNPERSRAPSRRTSRRTSARRRVRCARLLRRGECVGRSSARTTRIRASTSASRSGGCAGVPVFGTFQGATTRYSRLERPLRPRSIRRARGSSSGATRARARARARTACPPSKLAHIPNPSTRSSGDAETARPVARGARDPGRQPRSSPGTARCSCGARASTSCSTPGGARRRRRRRGERHLVLVGVGRGSRPRFAPRLERCRSRASTSWTSGCRIARGMRSILSAADVYAFPSRHEGLPVVAARGDGLRAPGRRRRRDRRRRRRRRRRVSSSRATMRTRSPDAIGALLADAERRAELGRRARARVEERFSLEAVGAAASRVPRRRIDVVTRIAYIVSAYKLPGAARASPAAARRPRRHVRGARRPRRRVARSGTRWSRAARDLDVTWLPRHGRSGAASGTSARRSRGSTTSVGSGVPFDYAVLLTGQDYPLRPPAEIAELPRRRGTDASFMRHVAASRGSRGAPRGGLDRIEDWHVITYRRLHLALPLRRRLPGGLAPYGGSAYWCLASPLVHFVHGFLSENPDYVRFFEHVFVPDELFFQTIDHELGAPGHRGERRPAVPGLVARACARGPRRATTCPRSLALRSSSRGSSTRPWTREILDALDRHLERMTTSSADSAVGLPAHADERAEAPGWIENSASDRFRPVALVRDLWTYRELGIVFALSTLRVRYKQAAFGVAWAVLQPLLAAIIFSIVFGRLAGLPSDGIPYPVFNYSAMILWLYVSLGVAARGAEPRREPRPDHEGLLRRGPSRRSPPRSRSRRPRDRIRRARRNARRLRRDAELGGRPDAGLGRRRDARRRRGRLPALRAERPLPRRSPRAAARAPALALREPGRVLELARRGRVEVRLRPEPDGRRCSTASAGRSPTGPHRVRSRSSRRPWSSSSSSPASPTSRGPSARSRTWSDVTTQTAIEVESLSKRYRLGQNLGGYTTLRETLASQAAPSRSRRRRAPWALATCPSRCRRTRRSASSARTGPARRRC